MAPGRDEVSDHAVETACRSCSRSVKSDLKCIKCKAAYHPACAVRIAGMRVMGYNDLLCNHCSKADESDNEACSVETHQQLIKANQTLNEVILRMLAHQDLLGSEVSMIKTELCNLTAKLEAEPISCREPEKPDSKAQLGQTTDEVRSNLTAKKRETYTSATSKMGKSRVMKYQCRNQTLKIDNTIESQGNCSGDHHLSDVVDKQKSAGDCERKQREIMDRIIHLDSHPEIGNNADGGSEEEYKQVK